MGALDFGQRPDRFLELAEPVLFMGAGADDDEDRQAETDRIRVDQRDAPADDLPFLQLLDAAPAGVARQVRFRGQFIHADRRVLLQTTQNSQVSFIQFMAHLGMISQ